MALPSYRYAALHGFYFILLPTKLASYQTWLRRDKLIFFLRPDADREVASLYLRKLLNHEGRWFEAVQLYCCPFLQGLDASCLPSYETLEPFSYLHLTTIYDRFCSPPPTPRATPRAATSAVRPELPGGGTSAAAREPSPTAIPEG